MDEYNPQPLPKSDLGEHNPQSLPDMTDREILIEVAENMRYVASIFSTMQETVAERGIGGLMKDFMSNGR